MKKLVIVFIALFAIQAQGQFQFYGEVDSNRWEGDLYLSIITNYRKINGVYSEQIIAKTTPDSLGRFMFTGNQLSPKLGLYRIHVDNCSTSNFESNHFNGHCNDSKSINFLATGNDSIQFPFSFDKETFCETKSNTPNADVFLKIETLQDDMRHDFSQFRSQANTNLNIKNWYNKLLAYGENLNTPLAELYIFSIVSDRTGVFREHYLQDLKSSTYFEDLNNRLLSSYPEAPFTIQFHQELNADYYTVSQNKSGFPWIIILSIIAFVSLSYNFYLRKRLTIQNTKEISNSTTKLTTQEQKILDQILLNKTNKEIAELLFISLSTVKSHVNNIYKKLNVQSRTEAKALFKGN
ncbi:MAG: hypothetical protein BM564_08070 [Bacteroidetes bacterium MedPE-SWsnd-G2]|nr:MAG: hypothetical protein BM564_08070 [Bacteroidetes bacterium MedPE-SWsnd-G2]